MGITNAFRDAVEKADIMGLRIMMKDSLLVDPTFSEFQEMEALARNVSDLYDQHDGRELKNDKSSWNDDYMNKLMVQAVGNFSHERVEHLKEVVRHLRPAAARPQTSSPGNSNSYRREEHPRYRPAPRTSYQEQKRQDERDNRIIPNRGAKKAMGAVAGGIVGGAMAATVGGVIITTAGVLLGAAAGAKLVDELL